MDQNGNDLSILRAQTEITKAVETLEWVARHIDDVEITSLEDSKFRPLIQKAARSLERICEISPRHGTSVELQTEALKLHNYINHAKGQLVRVRIEENPQQYWQPQCQLSKVMLSEISQKLGQSKREGAIFDYSDGRWRPLKAE